MPAKEIKELRKSEKLREAFIMAKAELDAQPDNIWAKRNISWVYYDYLIQSITSQNIDNFIHCLTEIKKLELPAEDKMLIDNIDWKTGMFLFRILKTNDFQYSKLFQVYELTKTFTFTKPSEGYSFLFKALHKLLKEGDKYLEFADWWNFENFRDEDFQNEKLPGGKEVMSLAEQAYIAYAKHLLPKQNESHETSFNKEKARLFIEELSTLEEKYPKYQYPPFFKAKLLLALGKKDNILETILPFVKMKKNDFWAWEILADALFEDSEKVFACYCKALTCFSPDEMLISLRQKMAKKLLEKKFFNEAKTEIEILTKVRTDHGFNIPNEVLNWKSQEWYKDAINQKSNIGFYKKYAPFAESILFHDIEEELIIVDFINTDKKMLYFIASETKYGFLKYSRFFKEVKIGDVLKVRFQGGSNGSIFQLYTAVKTNDDNFKKQFFKEVDGIVQILPEKPFGFVNDIYIHPSIVTKLKLTNGSHYKSQAIKSLNKNTNQWTWKLIQP